MNRVIGLKLTDKDKKLIKQIEDSGMPNSELLRKALDHYFKSVNQNLQEKTKREVNQVNQTVNHAQQEKYEKPVNQVNQKVNREIQVIENYELMEYLKRDHDWLKDRIEHFENTQDKIFEKIDTKTKKETEITRYRM